MLARLIKSSLLALLFSVGAFAQDINNYQPPLPFTNNYVARSGSVNLQNCTGASACWALDESSGSIVDSIASLTIPQHNAANTYSVGGNASYGTGITMNATAGGFTLSGAQAAVEFGTGSGNVLVSLRINGAMPGNNFNENFCSTVMEAGTTGWSFRLSSDKVARFGLIASDATTVVASWGNGTNDSIFNAHTDNLPHRYEVRIDRAGATVELLVDNVTYGTVSIATLAGKTIGSSGVGVGNDYRAVDRNVPITVWFARVKKSAT